MESETGTKATEEVVEAKESKLASQSKRADTKVAQSVTQDQLAVLALAALKRMDEKKYPQKLKSKKKRRAAAKQARRSRKANR